MIISNSIGADPGIGEGGRNDRGGSWKWGEREGAMLVSNSIGADPGSGSEGRGSSSRSRGPRVPWPPGL